jgi:shikimate dehydrogenase
MTNHYAVLGSPISHSKSPLIHSTIFDHLNTDADYTSHDVIDLADFLKSNRGLSGVSVTMPLKDQAFAIANDLDFWAQRTESVNTLKKTDSGWAAYNTDVFGLRQAAGHLTFQSVAVLGTGATARSALAAFQGSTLMLWGRSQESASELSDRFDASNEDLETALSADLVVSTIPGQALTGLIARDAEYPGALISADYGIDARQAGASFKNFVSGLEMLIWQAVGQQRIFTGLGPNAPLRDEDILIEAIKRALDVAK